MSTCTRENTTADTVRRPGRPRQLHASAVVDAALECGLPGITFAAIAEQLGVGVATVYRCVPGLDDLRDLVLSRLVNQTPWPSADLPWQHYLRELSRGVAAVLASHRGVAEFCEPAAFGNSDLLRVFGAAAEALVAEGFDTRDAVVAVDLIMHLTFDSLRAPPPASATNTATTVSQARNHALGHGLPSAVGAASVELSKNWSNDDALRLKVSITIAGIEHLRAGGLRLA